MPAQAVLVSTSKNPREEQGAPEVKFGPPFPIMAGAGKDKHGA